MRIQRFNLHIVIGAVDKEAMIFLSLAIHMVYHKVILVRTDDIINYAKNQKVCCVGRGDLKFLFFYEINRSQGRVIVI